MSVTIFYGEDAVRMDQDLLLLKKEYASNELFDELPDLPTLTNKLMTQSLFSEKKLAVFKNIFLFQVSRGKVSKKMEEIMKFLSIVQSTTDIAFVEEDSNKAKYYRIFFPKGNYRNYAIPAFMFSYLDNLKPGNFKKLHELFRKSIQSAAIEILFYMTKRRVKELLQISYGELKGSYQPWQLGKLKAQSREWTSDKLLSMYNNLFKIEKAIKTGQTPYLLQENLEIFFALYM